MHQKRNRYIHPPKLIPYHNHGETSLAVLRHTNDASKASHCQPVDHADNDGANEEIEHGSNNNDADDEDKDEDTEVNVPKQQRPRTITTSALHNYTSILVLGSMF